MCVAIRSRNQRSCEMTTAHPAKFSKASSNARSVFTSRSLVGSSSRRTFAPSFSIFAWWQCKRQVFNQQLVAVALAHFVCFDYHVAQARTRRNVNLQILATLFRFLLEQLFISIDARLPFGVARLGRHANPFQLALQSL